MRGTYRTLQILTVGVTLLALGSQPALPCSTFVLKDGEALVFGANLDFFTSLGLVVVNQRGVAKTALLAPPETPARWVSKYGSITFNQMGRELPFGGMNEQGLVIQMMWLDETAYPPPDERPGVMELQWIQYQLDNAATVEDVLRSDCDIRISVSQSMSSLHYLVCDRRGEVAAVEFVDGRMVSRSGATVPVAALTNSTYADCLQYRAAFDSLDADAKAEHAASYDSKDRFVRIERAQRDFAARESEPAVTFAFDLLQSVSAPKRGLHCTAWSIVYDIRNMRLHFRTYENREAGVIDFGAFDYACSPHTLILDMNSGPRGDASGAFVDYTTDANAGLVTSVMKAYREAGFLTGLTESSAHFLAYYPERLTCE